MLEKLGLPAKPSLRGNSWVIDASHCQGCSSQFTFINRKHHCRRCGGIFCNTCTQQRMALRGQGDSPVRICDPCKKQEEAARSERYGHKNRAGKAASKVVSRGADEVLNELLGGDSRGASSNEDITLRGIQNDMLDVLDDEMSIASDVSSSSSPEELRQQAMEEKNKYKALKGEGKSSEALKAFKRAKELERQAAAMELQLRKSRKRALASSSISSIGSSQKTEEIPSESSQRGKNSVHKGKKKDDINDELKALGWSETDIHEVERKPATTSVESELLNLMGETSGKAVDKKGTGGVDKSEVVALKKKALMLKREGRLAEAKEELKKAKVLEKQLEEQEFLADADESDDEISALIRSMDGDNKHDNSSIGYQLDSGFDFHNLGVDAGDIGVGNAIEVTDDDMYDPDLFATLKSLGWTEEPDQPAITTSQPQLVDKEQLKQEVLSLKKEALAQKRAGNAADAISLLKKAKLLEKDLQGFESHNSGPSENHSELEAVEPRSLNGRTNLEQTQYPKSRVMIQKELLALKKKALVLRREGKLDEAEEELQKGKILEQQLEDMDNAPKTKAITLESTRDEVSLLSNQELDISTALPSFDDEGEGDITEQDLHDPAYLTLLNSMGWQDEDKEATTPPSKLIGRHDLPTLPSSDEAGKKKTKSEIQRELLGLKRKAMALRRQGQSSEAEEALEMAKELESKLAEMEAIVTKEQADEHVPELSRTEDDESTDSAEPASTTRAEMSCPFVAEPTSSQNDSTDLHTTPQQLILIHKRKALALKREGKLAEAREELKKAKQLEKELEEEEEAKPRDVPEVSTLSPTPSISSTVHEELSPPNPAPKPMSSHERFKLQRECLNHKRSALKLRREGRGEEADAELQIAKTLEAQLEEASGQSQGESSKEEATKNDVELGDLLDPQILSALRAIGIQDDSPAPQPQSRAQPMKQPASAPEKGGSSSQESVRLEAEIKAEKVKALNLKRSGKQAEALDCLRRAKQLEKKLSGLPA